MSFKFKKLNNESGLILFIVLMTSIVIMIYSVGILTQSVNEINYAQQQIDQITHDQETKGAFWNAYANGMSGITTGGSIGAGNDTLVSGRHQTVAGTKGQITGPTTQFIFTAGSDAVNN